MDGKKIKVWRAKQKLSQDQLAALLGVDPITVSRWERGIQIAPDFLDLALLTLGHLPGCRCVCYRRKK